MVNFCSKTTFSRYKIVHCQSISETFHCSWTQCTKHRFACFVCVMPNDWHGYGRICFANRKTCLTIQYTETDTHIRIHRERDTIHGPNQFKSQNAKNAQRDKHSDTDKWWYWTNYMYVYEQRYKLRAKCLANWYFRYDCMAIDYLRHEVELRGKTHICKINLCLCAIVSTPVILCSQLEHPKIEPE